MDTRHLKRRKTAQLLFSHFFGTNRASKVNPTISAIINNVVAIDTYIDEFALIHASNALAKVDLSILRLAVYELLIESKVPPKVVMNEAVELAHEYGSENSPAFVNAILGGLYKKYKSKK